MKSDSTNTILIFALGIFAVLDVLFAVRTVVGSRELRTLQIQAQQSQMGLMSIKQLGPVLADVKDYNSKHPNAELTQILKQANPNPTPATH
jgi:hypothetical protein